MAYTELGKVTSKQFVFRTNGVKVEIDPEGNLYFNGSKADLAPLPNGYTLASATIYRTKNPKRVVGVRKRKAALMASVKQYNISLKYIKG
jgi:hypothetical protein